MSLLLPLVDTKCKWMTISLSFSTRDLCEDPVPTTRGTATILGDADQRNPKRPSEPLGEMGSAHPDEPHKNFPADDI